MQNKQHLRKQTAKHTKKNTADSFIQKIIRKKSLIYINIYIVMENMNTTYSLTAE